MRPFGVYVHVPFCRARCDYCAFATWTDREALMAPYADACIRELELAKGTGMPVASSVYFGGGTPSALPPGLLCGILDRIPRVRGAEVTVECNPGDVTAELTDTYVAAGVNRLSFGVQSLEPTVLASLGRPHDAHAVFAAVGFARESGIDNFNIDLIYGAAEESDSDWVGTLEGVIALGPPHVSAYALTVEPGTALAADRRRHPDDDVQARRYQVADEMLGAAGLAWYEVSNWARPGRECRHNQLYWSRGDYRGIGVAAHSHVGGRRLANVRSLERYMAALSDGRSPVVAEERLSGEQRALEGLWLRVRTRDGVPAASIPESAGIEELLERDEGRVVLSTKGRLLVNEVARRLEVPAPAVLEL